MGKKQAFVNTTFLDFFCFSAKVNKKGFAEGNNAHFVCIFVFFVFFSFLQVFSLQIKSISPEDTRSQSVWKYEFCSKMRWNTSFSVFVVLGTVKNYATAANENKFYFCYIQQWMSWPIFRVESSKRGGSANFAVFFAFYKYFCRNSAMETAG